MAEESRITTAMVERMRYLDEDELIRAGLVEVIDAYEALPDPEVARLRAELDRLRLACERVLDDFQLREVGLAGPVALEDGDDG